MSHVFHTQAQWPSIVIRGMPAAQTRLTLMHPVETLDSRATHDSERRGEMDQADPFGFTGL